MDVDQLLKEIDISELLRSYDEAARELLKVASLDGHFEGWSQEALNWPPSEDVSIDGLKHRVALITHGGFYHFFLSQLIDVAISQERTHWFHLNNVGVSHISFEEHGIRVNYLNRVDFLPANLIT